MTGISFLVAIRSLWLGIIGYSPLCQIDSGCGHNMYPIGTPYCTGISGGWFSRNLRMCNILN